MLLEKSIWTHIKLKKKKKNLLASVKGKWGWDIKRDFVPSLCVPLLWMFNCDISACVIIKQKDNHIGHQGTPGTEDMEIKKKPFLTATCSAPSVWVPRSVPVLKAEKRWSHREWKGGLSSPGGGGRHEKALRRVERTGSAWVGAGCGEQGEGAVFQPRNTAQWLGRKTWQIHFR